MISFSTEPDHYESAFEGVTLIFERLRVSRDGQLGAEVTVHATGPIERQIHSAWAVITTTDGRSKLAKHVAARAREINEETWHGIIETACVRVREAHRLGDPAIHIGDAPELEAAEALVRDTATGDPILLRNELNIWFGDGEAGKSMDALLNAAIIHTGRSDLAGFEIVGEPMRVGYVDWETSAATQKARLRRIFGEFYPKDLVYIPGAGIPLADSVDRIRRIIREERLGFLVLDSVSFSAGGPPEEAATAAAYLNALQRLGVGTTIGALALAHVTKADTRAATEKPFGSAFWHNGARMTWYLRRNEGHGDKYTLGMFCKKNNLGRRSRPVGLTLNYAGDSLVFGRTPLVDDPDLAGNVSLSVRIHSLLLAERRAMTYAQLGEALDTDPKVVKETCRRGIGTIFTKVPSEGREVLIGLMATELEAV